MKQTVTKYWVWFAFLATLLVLPHIFKSNFSMTLISQIGIVIITCLSFNLLLGEGGMLSFGHAVYSGMGGYFAMHALNAWGKTDHYLPVTLLPLVGGLGSLVLASFLGFVSTRKSGTTFAMITLGTSELIASMALMFVDFFGGEAGLSGNRVTGHEFFGITYGPQIQVYYLISGYCFLCVFLMYFFTKTPLGKLLNAVRDNPVRVEFIGYNTTRVRWIAFLISGFFAGIAGGLAAINFELVNSEVVGPARSGAYILFTYLGGIKVFFGPIIGAVLLVLTFNLFSQITKAWLLYLGMIFFICVLYLPTGVSGLIIEQIQLLQSVLNLSKKDENNAKVGRQKFVSLWLYYGLLLSTLLALIMSLGLIIEMLYQLQLSDEISLDMVFAGFAINPADSLTWGISIMSGVLSFAVFQRVRRNISVKREELNDIIKASAHDLDLIKLAIDKTQYKAQGGDAA
jgi:branched-chain amino acid transport system permease protein